MSPIRYKKDKTMSSSDIETADRLTRRRARMLPFLALIFLTQQISYFAEADARVRMVDHIKVGAWLLLSIVLLLALAAVVHAPHVSEAFARIGLGVRLQDRCGQMLHLHVARAPPRRARAEARSRAGARRRP